MDDDDFNDILSQDFENIRRKFRDDIIRHGYIFDEDIFIDVYLRCIKGIHNRGLNRVQCIKYLWVAYLNKLKQVQSKKIFVGPINYDIEIIDEPYNISIDNLYKYIIKVVEDKFGENITHAWVDHFCYDKTYKELEPIYKGMKFNFEFKRIKKYILTKLIIHDRKFQDLLENMHE